MGPEHTRASGPFAPVLAGLLALLVTGCSAVGPEPAHPADAASTITRLGAVPIPTASGPPGPMPATLGHPQLLPIGGAVLAQLPEGTATVTALGPDVDLPPGARLPVEDAEATITVRAQDAVGSVVPRPEEFTARDDHGRDVALTGVPGPAGPGTSTLRLTGHFDAGSAQVTWRHDGSVVGVWAFVIELD